MLGQQEDLKILTVIGVCECGCRTVYFLPIGRGDTRIAEGLGRTASGKRVDVGPRRPRLRPTNFPLPTLRRRDARHRDLRPRTAHPRTAGFTESTMSIRRSPRKSSLSALHRTALTRTFIVTAADILRSCTAQPQRSASCRPGISSRGAMAVAFIAVIDTPGRNPSVQIPIAHRRR